MKKSRLIEHLDLLEKSEKDNFLQFLDFVLTKKSIELRDFARILLKSNHIKSEFTKEDCFTQLYPNKPYNDLKIRHLMSQLLDLVRRFLSQKLVEEDKRSQSLQYLRFLGARAEQLTFEDAMNQQLDLLTTDSRRNIDFHFHKFLIYQEHHLVYNKIKRFGNSKLKEMSEELSIFFVAQNLRIACYIIAEKRVNQLDYVNPFIDEVLHQCEEGKFIEFPSVAIYFNLYKALRDEDRAEFFDDTLGMIYNKAHFFTIEEQREIILLAINYCIRKINFGKEEFAYKGLQLIKFAIIQNALLEGKLLSTFTYKNAILLAMICEEYDWAENFTFNYKKFLPLKERENTYQYNIALVQFKKRNYDACMEILQNVEFKDVLNNLSARRMLLRIYFERKEYQALESFLDSFTIYINRKKEIGYHKSSYLLMLKYIKKSIDFEYKSKEQRYKLISEIKAEEIFPEKAWLIDQLRLGK